MSISLIALRIEIDNNYSLLQDLHFISSKALKAMENEAKLRNDQQTQLTENVDYDVNNLSRRHRGSRELHEIEVETILFDEQACNSVKVNDCTDTSTETAVKLKQVTQQTSTSRETTPDAGKNCGNISPHAQVNKELQLKTLKQIQFYSGNSSVEITKGILHLFKENKQTPLSEEAERSEMICLLSVPTSLTTHDLLQFTAPVHRNVKNLRIIRDNKPNQFMVLIKFRNQKSADEFYNNFNGVRYNTIEADICHLVYVARVETIKENEKPYLPMNGHTELPTCPVCLERMDESVEGILTILCNHTFHSNCLDKWGDLSCPVCRHSQTPESIPIENQCFECGSQQDSLWICVICGHIGCGRYVEGHAYKHYTETGHTYAMQLGENNRVWDYAGDNYVHRLLQNKSDGKPVEFQCQHQTAFNCSDNGNSGDNYSYNYNYNANNDEKIDSVQLEYTYLLTNQLEAQRAYFEDSITKLKETYEQQICDLNKLNQQLITEKDDYCSKYDLLRKEKCSFEKKFSSLNAKLVKLSAELDEERAMNKCLRENQIEWIKKLTEQERKMNELISFKDKESNDLKEQLRDLMFYLEAQQKLRNVADVSKDEIESGQIVLPETQTDSISTASGSSNTSTNASTKSRHKARKKFN